MTLSQQELEDLRRRAAAGDRLATLINQRELDDFLRGVQIEAVYQVERWGAAQDRGKRPADWFWLIGYLTGKALHAANAHVLPRYRHIKRGTTYEVLTEGDNENSPGERVVIYRSEADGKVWVRPAAQFHDGRFEPLSPKPNDKALHHCISAAAALYNWHCAIVGVNTSTLADNSDGEAATAALQSGRLPKAGTNDAT
jgi:Protein of unknown function (DUF1653)